jgi:catechol 1,2-dioxygenase
MHGKVTDCVTGEPVRGAVVNVWQSSTNGLYDQQDPVQMTGNLRGRFKTDKEGRYSYYCLYPTPYGIPSGDNCKFIYILTDK